ncbi:MAG: alpha/beta fold hydrolase, partial [Candidatus Micrarchaeota archaeon]
MKYLAILLAIILLFSIDSALTAPSKVIAGVELIKPSKSMAACGDSITTNTILTSDMLNCPGNGIVFAANNIVLDCKNHEIAGAPFVFGVGIIANSRQNIRVVNCKISNFFIGVQGISMNHSNFSNDTIINSAIGVVAQYAHNNSFFSNNISLNTIGIVIDNSKENNAKLNRFNGNGVGITVFNSSYNFITQNNISKSASTGIFLHNATFNGVDANNLTGNAVGIDLLGSKTNDIRTNLIQTSSLKGIYAHNRSNSNSLIENYISENMQGIFLESESMFNMISGNYIQKNPVGMNISKSDLNLIWNNYFNNTLNAQNIESVNIWNVSGIGGTNIIGKSGMSGNYWSDYKGFDLTEDGIGDLFIPHNSSSNITNGGDFAPLAYNICGKQINFSIKMGADIACPMDGPSFGKNGIELDCDKHKLQGSGWGHDGITSENKTDIAIKNCIINGFENGIYFRNTNFSGIWHVESWNNTQNGIFFNESHHNTMDCAISYECNKNPLYPNGDVFSCENPYDNGKSAKTSANSATDFPLQPKFWDDFTKVCNGNKLHDNSYGFRLFRSTYNYIGESEIYSNFYGIMFHNSSGNVVNSSNISSNGILSIISGGIAFEGNFGISEYNTLENNRLEGNYHAIDSINGYNNYINKNKIKYNTYGFWALSGTNQLANNRICKNDADVASVPIGAEVNYGSENSCETGNWDAAHGGPCEYACKTPVLLIHGISGDKDSWDPDLLPSDYRIFLFDYGRDDPSLLDRNKAVVEKLGGNFPSSAIGSISKYSQLLPRALKRIKEDTLSEDVDIVVHSMGGLFTRYCINFLGCNNIRKFVMLSTPNHGSDIAGYSPSTATLLNPIITLLQIAASIKNGDAGSMMIPHSDFLNTLNKNNGAGGHREGSDYLNTKKAVQYHAVSSYSLYTNTITHSHIFGASWAKYYYWDGQGDGIVLHGSTKLDGV